MKKKKRSENQNEAPFKLITVIPLYSFMKMSLCLGSNENILN